MVALHSALADWLAADAAHPRQTPSVRLNPEKVFVFSTFFLSHFSLGTLKPFLAAHRPAPSQNTSFEDNPRRISPKNYKKILFCAQKCFSNR